jgi:hypothetical protein
MAQEEFAGACPTARRRSSCFDRCPLSWDHIGLHRHILYGIFKISDKIVSQSPGIDFFASDKAFFFR